MQPEGGRQVSVLGNRVGASTLSVVKRLFLPQVSPGLHAFHPELQEDHPATEASNDVSVGEDHRQRTHDDVESCRQTSWLVLEAMAGPLDFDMDGGDRMSSVAPTVASQH